jgi:hypothetical protein
MNTKYGYIEVEYRGGKAILYVASDVGGGASVMLDMSLNEVLELATQINRTLGEHK